MAAPHQGEVWVFEHGNYGGRKVALTSNMSSMKKSALGNDAVSSLRCGPATTCTLFADDNFKGKSQTFSGDVPYVGDAWNDKASSITVQSSGGAHPPQQQSAPPHQQDFSAPPPSGFGPPSHQPAYAPPAAYAQSAPPQGYGGYGPAQGQVWLFSGPNYTGAEVSLNESCLDLAMWGFDDQIQSVRVGPNTVAQLCADLDYGGTSVTLQGDVASLQAGINAKATSLKLLVNGQLIGQQPTRLRSLATESNRPRGINLGSVISTAAPLVMNALKNKHNSGGGGDPSGGMQSGGGGAFNLGQLAGAMQGGSLDKSNIDVGKMLGILAPIVLNAVKSGQGVGGITSGVMGAAPQLAGAAFGMGGGGMPSAQQPQQVSSDGKYPPPQTALEAQLMQENQQLRAQLAQLQSGGGGGAGGGYPPQQGGYPPQQGGGYPPQQGGYGQAPPGPAYGAPGYSQ